MSDPQNPPPYTPPPPPQRPTHRARWITIIIVIVFVVAGATVGAIIGATNLGRAAAMPTTFTSPDGYSIVFAGKPTEKDNATTGLRQAEVTNGRVSFLVESETLPTQVSDANTQTVLSGALDGGAKALNGTATSARKTLTLDGEPAESQTFSFASGSFFILGSLHDGDKFVGIVVINATTAERQKFVDSFRYTH